MRRVMAGDAAITELIAAMEVEATADGGWSRRLVSPASGERWLETYMQSELQGGGYRVLIRLPAPERAEWLELVAESPHTSEIWVAAMALGEDPDAFEALLGVLREAARREEWQRLGIAATWSGITSPMNRRPIMGKGFEEITDDAQHFERIAAEASRLLARAEENIELPFYTTHGWPDAPHA